MGIGEKSFNNLTAVVESLPAKAYFEQDIYDAELSSVWYRNWIYAGRADEVAEIGDYKALTVGTQNILLVRSSEQVITGFFNTCRHRGSILCTEASGSLTGKSITCPYHRWTYSLQGGLLRTPQQQAIADFDTDNFSLYAIAVEQWGGSIFINLAGEAAPSFTASFDPSPEHLDNWPLRDLKVAHSFQNRMHCNWKIFWENFVECYHCPGLHPELCDLVPMYKRTFVEPQDQQGWEEHQDNLDPRYRGGLKAGALSWTMDGALAGVQFPDLTQEELHSGYVYNQNLPSMFVVCHPDYARLVSILPDGPEHTLVKSEWLLSEASLAKPDLDLAKMVDFSMLVLQQDADVCEVNQRGLRSIAHQRGVLMPQEYDVANFHGWLREQHENRE
jgi:Rieske 2Fe-2S family protein